jgi:small subunit ribosomal protein S1
MIDERQEDTQPNPEPGDDAGQTAAAEPAATTKEPEKPAAEGVFKTPPGIVIVNQDDEDARDQQALQDMLGMYEESMKNLEEGEILKGRVLRVNENEVVVDIGFKSEGIIPLEEFADADAVKVGDVVDVFLEKMRTRTVWWSSPSSGPTSSRSGTG